MALLDAISGAGYPDELRREPVRKALYETRGCPDEYLVMLGAIYELMPVLRNRGAIDELRKMESIELDAAANNVNRAKIQKDEMCRKYYDYVAKEHMTVAKDYAARAAELAAQIAAMRGYGGKG